MLKNVESFWFRLINTAIYLLQDQSQQVRLKAARFAALLHCARRGGSQENPNLVQVSHALLLLLDLLLEEHWDAPGTLEVLLSHLPQSDLTCVLREASAIGGYVTHLKHHVLQFEQPQ